jgi:hypothetical protein
MSLRSEFARVFDDLCTCVHNVLHAEGGHTSAAIQRKVEDIAHAVARVLSVELGVPVFADLPIPDEEAFQHCSAEAGEVGFASDKDATPMAIPSVSVVDTPSSLAAQIQMNRSFLWVAFSSYAMDTEAAQPAMEEHVWNAESDTGGLQLVSAVQEEERDWPYHMEEERQGQCKRDRYSDSPTLLQPAPKLVSCRNNRLPQLQDEQEEDEEAANPMPLEWHRALVTVSDTFGLLRAQGPVTSTILGMDGMEHQVPSTSFKPVKDWAAAVAYLQTHATSEFKRELVATIPQEDREAIEQQVKKWIEPVQSSSSSAPLDNAVMTPELCVAVLTGPNELAPDFVEALCNLTKLHEVRKLASAVRAYRLHERSPSTFKQEWGNPRFDTPDGGQVSWAEISGWKCSTATRAIKFGCIIENSGLPRLAYLPSSTWKKHWRAIGVLACLDDESRSLLQ